MTDSKISSSDFALAKEVYRLFQYKNFENYYNLYLELDTIFIKDVFDNFKETCYKNYKLDPVYYTAALKLSHAASLKFIGPNLEFLFKRIMRFIQRELEEVFLTFPIDVHLPVIITFIVKRLEKQ